jgi:hypothetical protein
MRSTQFAGDHYYCDIHARAESDFGESDSYACWVNLHEQQMKELFGKMAGLKKRVDNVLAGAPELLKKEMPTHRHAEKLLAQNGVSKDDPDYHHHLNNTIKHLRQFGNIDLINKSDDIDEDYDVVVDTLKKQRDILWKMTQQNMNSDMFNIMDQIRLEQIDQLDKAIVMWKARND